MSATLVQDLVKESSERPNKKRKRVLKTSIDDIKPTVTSRSLFAPFRALGIVTNHVPFVLQTRTFKGATDGPRVHILTCLGRSWALWEGGKMQLLFVGTYDAWAVGRYDNLCLQVLEQKILSMQ